MADEPQTWYAKCRAAGRCIRCPKPATHGVRCEEHAALHKQAYRVRKQAGCVDCPTGSRNQPEPGSVRCAACNARHRADYDRWKREKKCLSCGNDRAAGSAYCDRHWKNNKFRDRRKYRRLRDAVVAAYGGATPQCACPGCHETRVEFLQVDHVDGNGADHRRRIGNGGLRLYTWLRKHGFPPGFRLLCANCNHAMGRFGYCPHCPPAESKPTKKRRLL